MQREAQSSKAYQNRKTELWLAMFTAAFIMMGYAVYRMVAEPTPGGLLEHGMGIVGTMLMVFTELGYSFRKRVKWFRAGALRLWLSVHIFTGIVGPTMVLFHTTLKFNGLAMVTSLLTGLVVFSGFVGRYLYTAVPRTVAGVEMSREEMVRASAEAQRALQAFAADKPARVQNALLRTMPAIATSGTAGSVLLRGLRSRAQERRLKSALRGLDAREREIGREIAALQRQAWLAEQQLVTLDAARRLLGIWHLVHLPIGLTLFGSVVIHIIAVIYYGATVVQ